MVTTHRLGRSALLPLLWVGFSLATLSQGSKATGFPVLVHRRVATKPCELTQNGSLVITKQYAWVEIEGEKSETYSPELGPGDYLSAAAPISGRVAKDAHKSGFELRLESQIPADLPNVRALNGSGFCGDLNSAITEVEQAREQRRAEVQGKLYKPAVDDIVPAVALKRESTQSGGKIPSNNSGIGTSAGEKTKFNGTVFLIVLVDSEGNVKQSKVTRSLEPELDKKAAEEVAQWKFMPARKKGLPVPSVMPVEITFNLQ